MTAEKILILNVEKTISGYSLLKTIELKLFDIDARRGRDFYNRAYFEAKLKPKKEDEALFDHEV